MTSPTEPSADAAKRLQGSEYVDDDGTADPALVTALAAHDAEDAAESAYPAVLAALARARLLVPVVAVLGETETVQDPATGRTLTTDKSSDMAAVLMTGADGRRALLAFTATDALVGWDRDARPVPVAAALAAQTAVQEGAAALVIDVAGPHRFVVSGDDLHRIAAGWQVVRLADGGWGWLAPERRERGTSGSA